MSNKALITRRATPQTDVAAAVEMIAAEDFGLTVEQQLPQGLLVRGSDAQYSALSSLNYRVKVLPDTNILAINDYQIDIETSAPEVANDLQVPEDYAGDWSHHLVQLAAPPTAEWTHLIEAQGVEVVEPIGAYGLFVVGSSEAVERLNDLSFVEWTGPFKPAYRIDSNLQHQNGRIQYVSIGVYPEEAVVSVRERLLEVGATIVRVSEPKAGYQGSYVTLIVEMEVENLTDIARLPNVRWLEYQGPPTLTDERSAQIVAENLDGAIPPNTAPVTGYQTTLTALGLTGAGITIGICDSGVDNHDSPTMHTDLRNRMAFFADVTSGAAPVDTNGHGTHVAGIAVGNATTGETDPEGFLLGLGVAPGAQFGSVNAITGSSVTGQADWVQQMAVNGAEVMNNSWEYLGTAGANYSSNSRGFDQLVRDPDTTASGFQYLAIVFAAGNNGPNLSTISSPANAKNHIVVGNSLTFRPDEGDIDDIRGLRASSGRGPTPDNRILPTIVAPGTNVVSTRPTIDANTSVPGIQRPRTAYIDTDGAVHEDYFSISGTSMAAPHVSGLCALLIEWWRGRTAGQNPSPAMLKALLVNGAIDSVGGPTRRTDPSGNPITIANIPNGDQGWGRVSLENILLQAPASDRGPKIFVDQRHALTTDGQEYAIRVAPADTARPLRITLVWTDAPGAAGASPALVNDLDLEVLEESSSSILRGNVFANGFSTTGGSFDTTNNIECVYIQNPSGTYDIRVIAAALRANARPPFDTTPWQDFALVIDNAQYAAADPVSIVPVIDRSGSMVSSGYVDITRISSRQFVDLMNVDDQVGVVSFGSTANVEYPTGASPAIQTITDELVKDAATAEIDGITFGGSTFMGGGIEEARQLLNPVTNSRAMVMLSDGYDNQGFDSSNPTAMDVVATLPANLPIYTCAMGPLSDQTLLEQIATATDGLYYYMPTIDDLFEIYNFIRGQVSSEGIIVNESAMASRSRVGACVDAAAEQVTFTVAWAEPKLKFVDRDPRHATEISIRLRNPRGRLLHPRDSAIHVVEGDGYIIFTIQEPLSGQWYIEVETARNTHTRYTVGGFVRSPIRLDVSKLRKQAIAGIPLDVSVQVFDNQTLVRGLKPDARVISPVNVPDLLKRYADQLRGVRPDFKGDKVPATLARLQTLSNQLRFKTGQDILQPTVSKLQLREDLVGSRFDPQSNPLQRFDSEVLRANIGIQRSLTSRQFRTTRPAQGSFEQIGSAQSATSLGTVFNPPVSARNPLTPKIDLGRFVGRFKPTKTKGSYNIIVDVKGVSPISNTRFCRKELVSILVK